MVDDTNISSSEQQKKAVCSSEMLVPTYQTTQHHIPEDYNVHMCHCER